MAATTFLGSTAIGAPAALAVKDLKASVKAARSVRVQHAASKVMASSSADYEEKSRRDMLKFAGAMFALGVFGSAGNARAALVDDLLAKTVANKELNDKKRLATSGANTARAYTVQFGTCKFPENFTGCQDLAKAKNVPFLSDDIKLECEGKDKYKCGSNVFWKW